MRSQLSLPHESHSAARARAFVRRCLRDAPPSGVPSRHLEALDAALLVVSELVTNAVQHAKPRSEPIELEVSIDDRTFYLGVYDADPSPPLLRSPQGLAKSGRGLMIVGRVADSWGWAPTRHGGKCVWCDLGPLLNPLPPGCIDGFAPTPLEFPSGAKG